MQGKLGVEQANLSQYLAILRSRQIVANRKDGDQVFYSIRNPVLVEVLDVMRRYFQINFAEEIQMLEEVKCERLPVIAELFLSGIVVWLAGAAASLALWRQPATARRVACGAALAGSLLDFAASSAALFSANPVFIGLPFGNPAFTCAVRLDPLSAFFSVTLAALASAVSLYSFGYLRCMEGRRNLGAFGFFSTCCC